MKGKADLVQGLLRKAASDLLAMRASADAGSLDVACFHAQQAAEKYLKAYLAEHDREIPHTHNLYKLLALCSETNPAFDQLTEAAGLLTPFAVEARYDTEFWPTLDIVAKAEFAADKIRDLVASLVQSPVDPAFVQSWKRAREAFEYPVDLKSFNDGDAYPGFFDRVIDSGETTEFEDAFRAELVPGGRVERAAEVVYWKNYKMFGHKPTRRLLSNVNSPERWVQFVNTLKAVATALTWESFCEFKKLCPGFATPITLLSFYDPHRYPMVDKWIGKWWLERFPRRPQFDWNPNRTLLKPSNGSWDAYLAWAEFCREQASLLSRLSGKPWRARDVEMAVWSDKDCKLPVA